jgi:cystathionine beta-lyase family protein involved in aluminum resistance
VDSEIRVNCQLAADGGLELDALGQSVRPETRCAFIQRSCGYSWRKSLGVADIQRAISLIKVYKEMYC